MLSVHDEGGFAPCPAPFNLAAHVLAAAGRTPSKIALAILGPSGAERWSYERLDAAVRATAGGLVAEGLAPGDRVLLRLGNTVDFPIAFLAALAADLIPVPTSAQLTPRETEEAARQVAPALTIAAPGLARPKGGPVMTLDELRALRDHPPAAPVMGDPDRPGYIVFTSGTSGRPRAVLHAHRAIWARQMMISGWYGLADTDRLLHAGAFNWTYTLGTGLMDPWSVGATALIPAEGVRPEALPLLLRRHDATIFAAAPGVYRQMLKHHPSFALPKLRHGLSAGEKLPDRLRQAWEEATSTPVHEAFGMSECSTFVSGCPAAPAAPGSLGRPQPGRRVAIVTPGGAPVERGAPGILAVHRDDPGLLLRYWGAPEETAARFRGDWFLTGDSAAMDAEGNVTYLGRDDDMMNAGGYRVSPIEVERVLAEFPGLSEAAAAEVTVKADTTVIAGFYTAATELDETKLAAFCAERLARYKCPRLFLRVDALPKGANGKLLRRRLRDEYEAPR